MVIRPTGLNYQPTSLQPHVYTRQKQRLPEKKKEARDGARDRQY